MRKACNSASITRSSTGIIPIGRIVPRSTNHATGKPDLTRYKKYFCGPIGMVGFDGSWDGDVWSSDEGKALEDYTRLIQPNVILDNRSGYKPPQRELGVAVKNAYSYIQSGDCISPEGEVPATGLPGIDWETCQTMQLPNNWGCNRLVGFRPFNDLLRQLIDVTSKGGNMLLNVGPTAEGELLPQASTCLEKFAAWMKVNSGAIHGTTASPFKWPDNGELLVPVRNKVKRAWLLADEGKGPLEVKVSAQGARIALPKQAPDPIASVVAVEIVPTPENLAAGRPVEVSSIWNGRPELIKEHIADDNAGSMWAAEEMARKAWGTVDLQKERVVSGATLCDAPYHRTLAFILEAKVGGRWKRLAAGSTIGDKRELAFEPVSARVFRLVLEKTSDTPTLADFQLLGAELNEQVE